jgi:rhodanese-related sulfurtransferase
MMIVDTTPEKLHDLQIRDDQCQVIDLRDGDEFDACHIPGSINIPLAKFEQEHGRVEESKIAYFVCDSDEQEVEAVLELARFGGRKSCIVTGGIKAWKKAGLPVAGKLHGLPLERQLPMAAGTLILAGFMLSLANPLWLLVSALVAIDLIHLSMTGSCTLGAMLSPGKESRPKTAPQS